MMATLFVHPVQLDSSSLLWMLIPLLLAVAIVYKTVRTTDVRNLPLDIAKLLGYMAVGLTVLGAALWLIQQYWP